MKYKIPNKYQDNKLQYEFYNSATWNTELGLLEHLRLKCDEKLFKPNIRNPMITMFIPVVRGMT